MSDKVNVLCLKWGKRYGADYVNRLYRGVSANLSRPFRFVCVTDDPSGLAAGVETAPFDEQPPGMQLNRYYPTWPNLLSKLTVFRKGFAGLEGPTLFLDIDQLIVGSLDCFFDYRPGEFCMIHNWIEFRKRILRPRPFVGNSSCFRFEAGGRFDYVYRTFLREMAQAMDMEVFSTEQRFMTHAVGEANVNWWPANFVCSFKRSCTWPWPLNHFLAPRRPADMRILCFHGDPSPEQAIAGYRGRHLNTWTLPAPWVKELMERVK
ncbi:MAG: hypothetical protein IJG13_17815 [Kiritimatiellae bacterium]|nr:hypothetical protein [Kiritimatiellia bacterium]